MRNDLRPEPVVAVIGKPNVGKSALFNRLVRRRKAIVSDEPGVTRDVNYERVTTPLGSYLLADSAGLTGRRGDGFSKTQEFNRRLIGEAALVLFTCEAPEPTAEDHLVAEIVRKSGKPCVVVVNKIDREKFDDAAHGFYGFGFGEPVPVSAIHGTNIPLLERRILETLPQGLLDARRGEPASDVKTPRTAKPPATEDTEGTRSDLDRRIGVAIVGKPNVGKSSLLNLLTGKERALVTPIPGTTRDAVDEEVEFRGFTLRLIDTAGLRKRGKIRENVEYYSLIRAEEAVRASSLSILILDATEKISIQDKKIASIVVDEKKGLIVAANKWDLAEGAGITLKTFKEDLLYFFPHIAFAEIVPVSAKTGYNKIKLLEKILDVYHNYNRRVKTSELNSLIRQFSSRGSTVKYGYQKSAAPPVFEFFVGGGAKKDRSFQRFVLNSVRKCFDFTGVPIDILLRKNS